MTPSRIQRRRTKGWTMPAGAISVSRPSRWGNPYRVGDEIAVSNDMWHPCPPILITPRLAVELFRAWVAPFADEVRAELAGRDLACWCPLDQPCHASVLLEIANIQEEP